MSLRIAPSLLAIALAGALPLPALAAEPAPVTRPVTFEWNLRSRWEHVEDEAFAENADAFTLRLRAGVRWRIDPHWSALAEAEAIGALDDEYNSGANGRTQFPTITDPDGIELNQLWVARQGEKVLFRIGRQRLSYDNHRWLGPSGWRQNEQTFDALYLEYKPAAHWALRYAGLAKVHRVSGDDARDPLARERDLASHFLNASWTGDRQQWTGYAYLHEDNDVATASTATYGLRWHGDTANAARRWGATLEAARQVDYAENPLSFSHSYWLVEPSLGLGPTTLRLGWEHLGGNGSHALQTPLASLNPMNGWADRFGTTPANGLEDRYASATRKFGQGAHKDRFAWTVAWHDYRTDEGNGRYGTELNAQFAFPIAKGLDGLVRVADFRSDTVNRDATKFWLAVEWVGAK